MYECLPLGKKSTRKENYNKSKVSFQIEPPGFFLFKSQFWWDTFVFFFKQNIMLRQPAQHYSSEMEEMENVHLCSRAQTSVQIDTWRLS